MSYKHKYYSLSEFTDDVRTISRRNKLKIKKTHICTHNIITYKDIVIVCIHQELCSNVKGKQ